MHLKPCNSARSAQVTAGGRSHAMLLACIADAETVQEQQGALIEQFLHLLAQRYAVTVAPLADAARVQEELANYLQQTERLLLMPFGLAATRHLQSVIEPTSSMLRTATGEDVSQTHLTAPYATTVRPIFAPMEGLASPRQQLDPLVRQYPGWQSPYLLLAAGSKQIIFLCGQECEVPHDAEATVSTIIAMLASHLCQHESKWKRDGEILASYLSSLVSALLTEVFSCESTINAVPPSILLPPG